ncbi:MAG: hypothetical protein E7404_04145 [Ruminococcaceae bacterium]|nr:hypothetical protein [Oscillospiraceae bacterium]
MQFLFRRIIETLVTSIIISLAVVMASATQILTINILYIFVAIFSLVAFCVAVFFQAREHYDAIEEKQIYYKTNICAGIIISLIGCIFCFFAQISNFLQPYYSLIFSPMMSLEWLYSFFVESENVVSWLSLATTSLIILGVIIIVPLVFSPTTFDEE